MDREALEALLASYPRCRPELPAAHRESYVDHYRYNRAGERGLSRIVQRLEAWMHRQIAAGAPAKVLEIGAGSLNHVPYQQNVSVYDVIEPFRDLWEQSPHRPQVRRIYADISEVPEGETYDSILSVAVLEHLTGLPAVLARSGLLLREGGNFRAGFPSEGGLLWGLSWRLTTGVEYRLRRGLDYGSIMRHEHVNSASEIIALLRYFFERVELARFPLPLAHLSFYTTALASAPRRDRCRAFADQQRTGACIND